MLPHIKPQCVCVCKTVHSSVVSSNDCNHPSDTRSISISNPDSAFCIHFFLFPHPARTSIRSHHFPSEKRSLCPDTAPFNHPSIVKLRKSSTGTVNDKGDTQVGMRNHEMLSMSKTLHKIISSQPCYRRPDVQSPKRLELPHHLGEIQ